jgi:UDP-N-acetylglucosamine 3-dehydrogenase
MEQFKAAMIGCGRQGDVEDYDVTGCAMSHSHVMGFQALPNVTVVAAVDLVEERASDFAKKFNIKGVYTDYKEMIKTEKPDIVAISTWTATHREIVENCARLGVRAIFCEKPMATNYGDARAMKEICDELGVQLSFNHQRRFEKQYQTARALVNAGVIGKLRRIETSCNDLIDWGTHWFDMMFFYNNDIPAEWLIGQIDYTSGKKSFGVRMENQGMANIRFCNGVYGLMLSGDGHTIWADHRLLGTEGIIEVDMPVVRVRGRGDKEMRTIEFPPDISSASEKSAISLAIRDVVSSLITGREPELSARKALQATECTFATYESSRRRGRVNFPLDIDDNPLYSMLDAGMIGPDAKRK